MLSEIIIGEYDRLLTASDYDFTYRYIVADVMQAMIDTARQLADRHPLRTYDALQEKSGLSADFGICKAAEDVLFLLDKKINYDYALYRLGELHI